MRVVSVQGPADGVFSFWETDATSPTNIVPVGGKNTKSWHISENDGSPGSDPYGHVHGRRFAMTKPGLYVIGFQFFDASSNGIGGGPVHAPSDVIHVYMQAGISMAPISRGVNGVTVTFGAEAGNSYLLEVIDGWGAGHAWIEVAGPVVGDDHLHAFADEGPIAGQRFYRIKAMMASP
jgi:hypothetical protein